MLLSGGDQRGELVGRIARVANTREVRSELGCGGKG